MSEYQGHQAPQGYQQPQMGQNYQTSQPSQSGEGYSSPQSYQQQTPQGYQPPQGGQSYQPPQGGQGYQSQQGGQSYPPSQGGQGYQPPQGGQSYQPPQGYQGGQPESQPGPTTGVTNPSALTTAPIISVKQTGRCLAVFFIKANDLRLFRNTVIRNKTVLMRCGGRFIGITKTAEQLHKESQPTTFADAVGVLEFDSKKEANRFIHGERTFSHLDFFDTVSVWLVPIENKIALLPEHENKVNLLFSENTSADETNIDYNTPPSDQAGDRLMKTYILVGRANDIDRLRGKKPPACIHISQWIAGQQFFDWLKGDQQPLEEMLKVFGRTSGNCYFLDLKQDIEN